MSDITSTRLQALLRVCMNDGSVTYQMPEDTI